MRIPANPRRKYPSPAAALPEEETGTHRGLLFRGPVQDVLAAFPSDPLADRRFLLAVCAPQDRGALLSRAGAASSRETLDRKSP